MLKGRVGGTAFRAVGRVENWRLFTEIVDDLLRDRKRGNFTRLVDLVGGDCHAGICCQGLGPLDPTIDTRLSQGKNELPCFSCRVAFTQRCLPCELTGSFVFVRIDLLMRLLGGVPLIEIRGIRDNSVFDRWRVFRQPALFDFIAQDLLSSLGESADIAGEPVEFDVAHLAIEHRESPPFIGRVRLHGMQYTSLWNPAG